MLAERCREDYSGNLSFSVIPDMISLLARNYAGSVIGYGFVFQNTNFR